MIAYNRLSVLQEILYTIYIKEKKLEKVNCLNNKKSYNRYPSNVTEELYFSFLNSLHVFITSTDQQKLLYHGHLV